MRALMSWAMRCDRRLKLRHQRVACMLTFDPRQTPLASHYLADVARANRRKLSTTGEADVFLRVKIATGHLTVGRWRARNFNPKP
jgi:hypothetical protein